MNPFSKFRFLPVTIFVASMLLTVKIGDIWTSVDGLTKNAIQVAGAEAQTETPPTTPQAAGGAAPAGAMPPAGEQAAVPGGSAAGGAAPAGDAAQSKLLTEDPTLLTPQEIDLLQRLADRRREIDAREREMQTRRGMLAAAEAMVKGLPVSLAAFAHQGLREWVEQVLHYRPIDAIYVFSGQMAQYVPPHFPGRTVLDLCDVDSAKFEAYGRAGHGPKAWVNAREGRKLAAAEERLVEMDQAQDKIHLILMT